MGKLQTYAWLINLLDGPIYKTAPVSLPEEEQAGGENAMEMAAVPLEGAFSNNVLVVHQGDAAFNGTPEYQLLQKILAAVNCNLAEAGLLAMKEWPLKQAEALLALNPKRIICFGQPPEGWEAQPMYEVQQQGGASVVFAHELTVLSQDVACKKQLWLALKQMFNLN